MSIKLSIENVNVRLEFLKKKGVFVRKDDFVNQFNSLKESIQKFKVALNKIYKIHQACEDEVVHSRLQNVPEEEQTQLQKDRKALDDGIRQIKTNIFKESDIGDLEKKKEEYLNKLKVLNDQLN